MSLGASKDDDFPTWSPENADGSLDGWAPCDEPPRVSDLHLLWFGLLLAVTSAACDEGDARFTTKVASDFAPARHTVSVLGVYKDGRMSSDAWQALAPHVAPALGGANCEVGYDILASANGPLANAIDEYARADGPTDELMAQLSLAAKGDLVIVLTFAGKLPQRMSADAGAHGLAPTQPVAGGRGGGRSMHGASRTRGRSQTESGTDPNVLDISASVYSVVQARPVALVAMQYSGASLDDALTRFAAKLTQALPGTVCVGWNWDATIDPDRIRRAIDDR